MPTRKTLTINVTEEEHRQAKIIAATAGKTMKEIFLEAIERLKKEQEKESGSK